MEVICCGYTHAADYGTCCRAGFREIYLLAALQQMRKLFSRCPDGVLRWLFRGLAARMKQKGVPNGEKA